MTLDGKIDPDLDADADDLNLTVAIRRLVDPPRISAHEPICCNARGIGRPSAPDAAGQSRAANTRKRPELSRNLVFFCGPRSAALGR
jgi:hypothetical protein